MGRRAAWFAVALVLAHGSGWAQVPEEGALARVKRAGVLRWGADRQGGEPYAFEDPENPGTIIGFEVDIAEAIAKHLGVRAEFTQNGWETLVPAVERGSFDLALNGLEVTRGRVGRVRLSRPYFVYKLRLMVRRDDPRVQTAELGALKGLTVATLGNTEAHEQLEKEGGCEIKLYEGIEEQYADLEGKRVDAVLLDDLSAQSYGVPRESLRVVGDTGAGYYAAAMRIQDDDLGDAVDAALDALARSGELRGILAKWKIDGPHQERLVEWTQDDSRRLFAERGGGERPSFNLRHVELFAWGALITLGISVSAMALAIALGIPLALGRTYRARSPIGWFCTAYVELFRGTPVLLQLYVIYFGLPTMEPGLNAWLASIGLPAISLSMNAWTAAILGLGLNYAAYEAEIYRAGLMAVPKGQLEAAWALGMSTPLALRRVIVPQAARIALPGVTNDFVAMLKDSSLVSVIAVVELTKQMSITAVDVRSWALPGLVCAAFYLAMSYPLSTMARRLEKRLESQ